MRTNKRRKERKGGFLMTTGLLLIAAALLLTLNNTREQRRADEAAAAALGRMKTVMPQEDAPQTLALTDADGHLLDWPLDRQGEPMPWPVEDGAPVPAVVDGEGRTVYWTQLRGEERPVQASVPAIEAYPDAYAPEDSRAAQDDGAWEPLAPVTSASPAETDAFIWASPAQQDDGAA